MYTSIKNVLILVVSLGITNVSGIAFADFKITNLGTLGGSTTIPSAINSKGQVVGNSDLADLSGTHAFLSQKGQMIDLGTLVENGVGSQAADINDHGQVIGVSWADLSGSRDGFLWNKGEMINLGNFGGNTTYPSVINNRGQIAGISNTTSGEQRAFLWEHGQLIDLGTSNGANFTSVTSINERGKIVGYSTFFCGFKCNIDHAFLWDRGKLIDLGNLGGVCDGSGCVQGSKAIDINEGGQVVGQSLTTKGELHAFLWGKGKMTDLGTLGGSTTYVTDINERGQVVGYSSTSTGEQFAFLWEKGIMTNLGTLNGYSSVAYAINDRG